MFDTRTSTIAFDDVRVRKHISGATIPEFHEHWVKMKKKDGWELGEFSLEEKKHPALVPFNDLSDEYKRKNRMFWEVARSIARALEMPVVPVIRES